MRVREVSAWLYKHGWRGRAAGPRRVCVGGFGALGFVVLKLLAGELGRRVLLGGGSRSDALPETPQPGSAAAGPDAEAPG